MFKVPQIQLRIRLPQASPRLFPRVLAWTYAVLALEKLAFGVVAWVAFGDDTKEIVTGNLGETLRIVVSVAIGQFSYIMNNTMRRHSPVISHRR